MTATGVAMVEAFMSQSIPYYFKNKQSLLDKLESLRPMAVKTDAEVTAKHKQDEKKWLKNFRDSVKKQSKEFLAYDYERAKGEYRYRGIEIVARDENGKKVEVPNCPASQVEILDRAIAMVNRCPERAFRVNPGGDYHFIHMALSLGIDRAGAVC